MLWGAGGVLVILLSGRIWLVVLDVGVRLTGNKRSRAVVLWDSRDLDLNPLRRVRLTRTLLMILLLRVWMLRSRILVGVIVMVVVGH